MSLAGMTCTFNGEEIPCEQLFGWFTNQSTGMQALMVVGLIVVLGAAGAGYYHFKKKK